MEVARLEGTWPGTAGAGAAGAAGVAAGSMTRMDTREGVEDMAEVSRRNGNIECNLSTTSSLNTEFPIL